MAISGFALAGFVIGHMLGNLQIFGDPYLINSYGHKLHTLPYGLLWVVRFGLLFFVAAHIWAAVTLVALNKKARPEDYKAKASVQATTASQTMIYSGLIILFFIIFHLAHYTIRNVPGHLYEESITHADGTEYPVLVHLTHDGQDKVDPYGEPILTHNVHGMMIAGFSYWWISAFYIVATYLLCMHLSHGVSSMFQSLGLRNETWRYRLDFIAKAYGWIVFAGFAIIPILVLTGVLGAADYR